MCARENLCLLLHDHIKKKPNRGKVAVFPSFLNADCGGWHATAVAIFSFGKEEFVIPVAGSAARWQSSLGESVLVWVTPSPRGQPASCVRWMLKGLPIPNLYKWRGPAQLQSPTELILWLQRGLTSSSAQFSLLPFPHRSWSCAWFPGYNLHINSSVSFPEDLPWNTSNFLRNTIFLITAFLGMRLEIIYKMWLNFRNIQMEKTCFLHSRKNATRECRNCLLYDHICCDRSPEAIRSLSLKPLSEERLKIVVLSFSHCSFLFACSWLDLQIHGIKPVSSSAISWASKSAYSSVIQHFFAVPPASET